MRTIATRVDLQSRSCVEIMQINVFFYRIVDEILDALTSCDGFAYFMRIDLIFDVVFNNDDIFLGQNISKSQINRRDGEKKLR